MNFISVNPVNLVIQTIIIYKKLDYFVSCHLVTQLDKTGLLSEIP